MKVFVLRHGEAHPFAASDSQRRLTERGVVQTQQVLHDKKHALSTVTKVIASPYVRAQQTAALVQAALGLEIETHSFLEPDSNMQSLLDWLNRQATDDVYLLVSHQPLVGRFVDWLCGLPYGRCVMGTSALVSLQTDVWAASCGDLHWLHQP